MTEEVKFQFFEVCAEEQNYGPEQAPCEHTYDNNLEPVRIPQRAYTSFGKEKEIKNWYEEFIRNKFRYFSLLLKDAESADRQMSEMLGDKAGRWKLILDHWRKQADKEQLAYLYRISQIPEHIVSSFWYNSLPEFVEWTELSKEELNVLDQDLLSRGLGPTYQELESRIQRVPWITFRDEHIRSWVQNRVGRGITSSVLSVLSHLHGERTVGEQIGKIQEYFEVQPQGELDAMIDAPVTQHVTERVSLAFLDLVSQGVYEETYYIEQFLQIIRSEFKCDLCDYLEVQDDDQNIMLSSTTVDLEAMASKHPGTTEEQLRKELAENQSYHRGEGISGSILLCPKPDPWFHVGSNNLPEDPRKSIWRQELYEKLYADSLKGGKGKIHNFWTFPIFIEDKLIGAFRVVNKLDESQSGLLPGSWPFLLRLQLCMIAQRFSKLWACIKSFPGMSRPDLAARIKEWSTFIDEVRSELDLSWVSETFLSEVLEHLQSIVFQRIEANPVGCSLVILRDEDRDGFFAEFKEHQRVRKVEATSIRNFAVYYDKVSPDEAAFVFDKAGNPIGVVELQQKSDSDSEHPIAKTTRNWNSVAFLVERGHESILFYRGGIRVAEYFLYRRLGQGRWKMRYYLPILERICKTVTNIRRPVLEQVYKEVWQLSYRQPGAGIIIVEDLRKYCRFQKEDRREKLNESIFAMSSQRFADLTRRDGSVLMDPDGVIYRAGVYLKARKHVTLPEQLSELLARDNRGGRHRSGAEVCCACRNALVFIVSANRGISVLYDGHAIAWDF